MKRPLTPAESPVPDVVRRRPSRRHLWLAPVLTASLLGGMVLYGFTLPVPSDADPYHARMVELAQDMPLSFGDWRGRDEEVAREAQVLLNPNVIISRKFLNERTRETAVLLVVQCRDSRDLQGHWPPNCYPANGYQLAAVEPMTWTADGREYPGREYRFTKASERGALIVSNFLLVPDGRVAGEMALVTDASGDYELRSFGAAQVQVLTESLLTPQRRREVVEEFIAAYRPLIEAMRHREASAVSASGPASDPGHASDPSSAARGG